VPGYAVIGDVDTVGKGVTGVSAGDRVGALTVVGGYSEYLYWKGDRLIPVPSALDPASAVTLILNYIVVYQSMHRSAGVRPGEKALIIRASGGIGTALIQLGQLAGLKMYGTASPCKHRLLAGYGVIPIVYHSQDVFQAIREAEPDGLDVIFDGLMRFTTIQGGLSLLRRAGRMVGYGEPSGFHELFRILQRMVATNLLPDGKSFNLYGTSIYFVGDRRPFLEDWALLFQLLEEGKINPVIEEKFPILEAAQANARLESGQVVGNVVLVAPELL
jgi:NADPH:quinone reductase-like Zn-dependent oxidoreductase